MQKYTLSVEHENVILGRIEELMRLSAEELDTMRGNDTSVHFNDDEWAYVTEYGANMLLIVVDNMEYCVHMSKSIIVMVSEHEDNLANTFDESDTLTARCKMYHDECEYFQDSTVSQLRVPYSIMNNSKMFFNKLKDHQGIKHD